MKRFFALTMSVISIATLSSPAYAAEKGWRYWGYYQAAPSTTQWHMALTGPSVAVKDGSVEGWVFTLSSKSVQSTPPKTAPKFSTLCKGVKKESGIARVGLVVDFGNSAIAPKGEKLPNSIATCVRVAQGSLGIDVLDQATHVRASTQGFICAISSFPAKECSAEIVVPQVLLKK